MEPIPRRRNLIFPRRAGSADRSVDSRLARVIVRESTRKTETQKPTPFDVTRLGKPAVRHRQEQKQRGKGEKRDRNNTPPLEGSRSLDAREREAEHEPGSRQEDLRRPEQLVVQRGVHPVSRRCAHVRGELHHPQRRHADEETDVRGYLAVPGQDVQPDAEAEQGVEERKVVKQRRHVSSASSLPEPFQPNLLPGRLVESP